MAVAVAGLRGVLWQRAAARLWAARAAAAAPSGARAGERAGRRKRGVGGWALAGGAAGVLGAAGW